MIVLSALLGALLLFLLQKYLYRHYWYKNLSIDLHFSEEKAIEGQELVLYETVINKKLLPLPIVKVKFRTSKHLAFLDKNNSSVTDNYYRNDLISIMMYQKLTRSLSFVCAHRGYYTIDALETVCSDMFLSFEAVESYTLDLHLSVYPRAVDTERFSIPFQKILGIVLTKRFINEDPFEFRNIREYQSYDNLKAVNWKASAKTGTLKVNVFDYTASQQVKILLNLESETIWEYDDLKEESIRIAASFAAAFIHKGIPVSLYTNARDIITKDVISLKAGSGFPHIRTFHETLARIDTSLKPPAFVPTIYNECKNCGESDYLILISSYQKTDLQDLLSELKKRKRDFSWIIPINKEVTVTAREELIHSCITWET